MNKQVLIDEIKRIHASAIGRSHVSTHPLYSDGVADTCSDVIKLLEQLDEPQKPVVPHSAGALIEFYREENVSLIHILNCFKEWADTDKEHTDEVNWIVSNPETFMRAWLYGYEVEKEPLYVMPVPHVSFPVHYCVEDDHISFRQGNAQKFTQAELDKYFPDIKQFAVPVDEVEEG
ncbi:DUF1642 domain-containing protein [Enterococcus thailandicus]|uniref:DUF1642 domain-containing protein n=1 Tax=Enterococcus thailandicus TaxID=417368 RepID=A0A179EV29_ENTTH|nr:DUF1642 domain-containing protein [Enterococcus thailandicus]OAQ57071.1 hypothetical protein A6E74_01460 [Enterococcus thailandicus]